MQLSHIQFSGRWAIDGNSARVCAPASQFSFNFEGSTLNVEVEGNARFKVEIDGNEHPELVTRERKLYRTAENLGNGVHHVQITKKTETEFGSVCLYSTQPEPLPSKMQPTMQPTSLAQNRITQMEFIGDSYTVGFGNAARDPITGTPFNTTNANLSYGVLTAQKFGAEYQINAYSGRGLVQNYMGIAPNWNIPKLYEYTLGGEAPLGNSPRWDFSQFKPQAVCIFVGINDWQGNGPHPTFQAFDTAYANFLSNLRIHYSGAHFFLLSTDVYPQNFLPERVENVLSQELTKGNRDVDHFFLETSNNSGLDFHPNFKRHEQMANTLYQKISAFFAQKRTI